ncbi:MAG: O-antigen biosynthesis protein RfbC [uncultured Corynebacteriales bacterium]|uniref:O-antigen biosynthesis protein RfbC n=1 Tax=uncultured Mycobacteriales bacterium TaxID=581187 RepID=A0A6J4HGJ9_9ACTN|nr:MAG: O-antigen biosynthesis protein RfbC [uncultured Corynebacteriales bacterium]
MPEGLAPKNLRALRTRGYESPRPDVQAHVPRDVRRILELGCSSGALGAAIKARQDAVVVGVEIDPDYAADARARLDRVVTASVEDFLASGPPQEAPFDCLVCADVLEHLVDPTEVLRRCAALLAPGGHVVISVPNVLYWPQFRRVLKGDWPEDDEGIFDRTHLRWFTPASAVRFARSAGLTDVELHPQRWGMRRRYRLVSSTLTRVGLDRFTPAQLIVTARADPILSGA